MGVTILTSMNSDVISVKVHRVNARTASQPPAAPPKRSDAKLVDCGVDVHASPHLVLFYGPAEAALGRIWQGRALRNSRGLLDAVRS